MSQLPAKISLTDIRNIRPIEYANYELAKVINALIEYLEEHGGALQAFAKPVDEMLDRKLGPHPDIDPDLMKKKK